MGQQLMSQKWFSLQHPLETVATMLAIAGLAVVLVTGQCARSKRLFNQ
jgi:hypothetical protein